MAYESRLKVSIRDRAGDYYTANLIADGTYTISSQTSPIAYIETLPEGWADTTQKWERNWTYKGVFRAYAESMNFVQDGRAILLDFMYGNGGMSAYALVTVYKWNEATLAYDIFFSAEVDFSAISDSKQKKILATPLLQGGANELLKARSSSNFNIPFWVYDADEEEWVPNGDIFQLNHTGIKLLWRADWISGATASNVMDFTFATGVPIGGFNQGNHGAGINFGTHCIPPMSLYNYIQNNGTTTYIGNDILQPLLVVGSQSSGVDYPNELNFAGVNESRPYTGNNFCLKDVFPDATGAVSMYGAVKGKFEGDISTSGGTANKFIGFVIFEVNSKDNGDIGIFTYQPLMIYPIAPGVSGPVTVTPSDGGVFTNYPGETAVPSGIGSPMPITLNPDRVYVFGIVFDNDSTGIGGTVGVGFKLSSLEFTLYSEYNGGQSAPVSAPQLPPSDVICMRPYNLWQKLIQSIDSTETDQYGMPVIVGDYTGVSTYLSTYVDPDNNYDISPNRTGYTCENAIRNIKGIPYISISPADFFNQQAFIDGCGLGIEGDNFRIEKLEYFFEDVEILALGNRVSGLVVEPMSTEMLNNIKCGYKQPSTNNNFGVDEFNIPAEYNMPLNKQQKSTDMSVSSAITGMYEIEKMRAQRNISEISAPSSSNSTVIILTTDVEGTTTAYDPAGAPHTLSAQNLTQYANAQSTDSTAATDPYISGLYYPDTAINVGLFPAHNMYRNAPLLRSLTDQQDTKVLSYRRQYQQNYADPLSPLTNPGVQVNITGAHLVGSTDDIPVSSLGNKLFRPYTFDIEVAYPEGMFVVMNANPRGYISFVWEGLTYKGYIHSVAQCGGDNRATTWTLIAHPSTTDAQLKK